MNSTDRLAIRMLVRTREDFQAMRKRTDNRIGRKANGEMQNVEERIFTPEDFEMFAEISKEAKRQEVQCEKNLKRVLKRFPVYTEFLKNVKGVGEIAAGWIISEFDIERATTVSKMWQYAGLNPSMIRGKKRVKKSEYKKKIGKIVSEFTDHNDIEWCIVQTDEMIRGDKLTAGFISPYNKDLRTALLGVMSSGFIKAQNSYALEFYYPYKERLAQSEKEVTHLKKETPWKDVSKGHRDRAAQRYMIKMFLKDLYVVWRELEGFEVRPSYQEEYLGHKHAV